MVTSSRWVVLLALLGCAALGCKPGVGQPISLVTDYKLLAVYGEPAEARPGASVTYAYLLASPTGTVGSADTIWDICTTPKPPAESNSVSSACMGIPDGGAPTLDQTYTAPIPTKACQLFGPIAPPAVSGQPAVRPRDPDSTGGYYLPVQLWLPDLATGALSGFAFERISCNLASASSDIIAQYNSTYVANVDPGIDHTDLVDGAGNLLSLDAGTQSVPAGMVMTVQATFAAGSAETFPYYDVATVSLVQQQESLHMSWFVSGGSFEHDRTGVAAGDPSTSTSNQWTAPTTPGTYYMWLVLRDSRGGTATKSYTIVVT